MDVFSSLMDGFATALTPMNLLYAVIGVILGSAVGVLPGLGPAMTIALLLPVTYVLEPTSAFIMFAGIYYGGMYGGSTTSILLNTPGESSSVVTAIEGNKMAKAGRAAQALATAAIGSFVAGTIGTALLAVFAPIVVEFAVSLGSPSYFAIMVLALVAVTAVLGSSRLRGFASLGLGLAIGLVGMDSVTGQRRLTFGQPLLADGLDIVVVAVAIFAVGEALWVAAHMRRTPLHVIPVGRPWMGKQDWKRSWKPWLRGTAFGFPFGALPAGGAEIPTFLSYVTEKRLSKHPEEFGKGAIEGVAGPEAANNAAAAGTMTPLLALGLPTNATAAVMLAAFVQFGIQPGPLLFANEGPLVWALIASLFIGNFLLLLINLPLAPMWAKILQLPRPYLYAGILFFATLGAYSVNLQAFDLVLLLVLGALGFMMRRFGLPVLPLILGVILGPRIEGQLRKSLQLSAGDPAGLLGEPIAVSIYIILALILAWPLIFKLVRRNRPAAAGPVPATEAAPAAPSGSSVHADLPVHPDGAAHTGSSIHSQSSGKPDSNVQSDGSAHPDKKETP
ncbi:MULTISPECIES: tripartite tricarboxylate transporter permease [Pseudarthrobacter]|uniref:Tripartite tricarboxylate transporter TctA n=1 Tax=Pseudarthrobacter polychromogenes TaxID=1676 RepID=A0ABQ1XJR6_9MICC|nr:tripartite tricarboxylate transporter permease [Pseudarthrobacter polychromogenes]MBD1538626.1 tripartite tricarboxylate transporter permease [Arthrobacter sp. S13_S34]MBD1593239.1 tripartite tricarboxylate transporter permease [Arthrobacter sp. S1_S22]GGG95542.1 tripartite tricarboxylate transporter TctA [Pseudarthrobacter polychromogenes]